MKISYHSSVIAMYTVYSKVCDNSIQVILFTVRLHNKSIQSNAKT